MSARRQIIAALSEDSHGGIATLSDVDRAEQLVNAHAAEVRRGDAARLLEQRRQHISCAIFCDGITHAAGLLNRWAAENPAVATAEASTATPDFFQVGHTYTDTGTDWKFRVDTVTTHPEAGDRTALGWRHFRGEWEPYAYGEDDWEIHQLVDHIDATEAGEPRG